jgi:23S rRNA (uracil1939-C5)-methyltransferase
MIVQKDAAAVDVSAICPHYPACVGCGLIGIPYGEQLRRKQEQVRLALQAVPGSESLTLHPISGSPRAFGYRNQAKLVARRTRSGILLGIYRPGTHQVVDIAQCPVHDPAIRTALAGVRQALERLSVPTYDEGDGSGWLRYVVLRSSAWKKSVQVILVARDRSFAGEGALVRALRRLRGVSSVVLNLNRAPGNAIFGERFLSLAGDSALLERVGGIKLKCRPGAFLQANLGVARKIYARVAALAGAQENEVAVDLYCGVGAISFHLAPAARAVYGVEESPQAVLDAKENIRFNGFHNVRFFRGAAGEVLPRLVSELPPIDLITLNPPRKGADAETRSAIAASGAAHLVYVSCDPQTLARDLSWFVAHGYRALEVYPFDLLPQTEHVECVARLVRAAE